MPKGSWKEEISCQGLTSSESGSRHLLSKIVGKLVLISNWRKILQAKQSTQRVNRTHRAVEQRVKTIDSRSVAIKPK